MQGSTADEGTKEVRNMGKKTETTDYAARLKEDYERWQAIWKQGWKDPNYPDGSGLAGARGRIMHDKEELEKAGGEMPEEYHWPLPPCLLYTSPSPRD